MLAGGACAAESPEVPLGADGQPDAELAEGREVYSSRCARCHGSSGGGGTGPKLADGAVVAAYPDIADQVEIISNGKNGMPSFAGSLSASQVEAVTRYSREVLG
jgi:mono/diheme cytochrome c family protein